MDCYTWEAKYKDGTLIQEWEGNAYKDIDRSKLETFAVYHIDDLSTPVIIVNIQSGQHLIWRKRRVDTTEGVRTCTTYIAGVVDGDRRPATCIVHNELFNIDVYKFDADLAQVKSINFDVKLAKIHGDLYDE